MLMPGLMLPVADGDGELGAYGVGVDDVGHSWDCDDAVEVVVLDPVLELAGAVSGVRAYFEVGDDDNLGVERLDGRGLADGLEGEEVCESESHPECEIGLEHGISFTHEWLLDRSVASYGLQR